MSTDAKLMHNKLLSMGTGIFLLVFSIMVVVLDAANFLAIGLAFFVLLIGIMLVMVGAVSDLDKKKETSQSSQQTQTRTEIVREIVKVRCRYCNALNLETSQRCANCGAQM